MDQKEGQSIQTERQGCVMFAQVRGEIDRTNLQLAGRSSALTFQRGAAEVPPLLPLLLLLLLLLLPLLLLLLRLLLLPLLLLRLSLLLLLLPLLLLLL